MADYGCEEIAQWFSLSGASNQELKRELLELLRVDEPNLEAIARLAARHEPRLGHLVREELQSLPRPASLAVLRAWRDAIESDQGFLMVSERPHSPLSFARRRLVRVVTDVEETGITVRLSHVPGRHPSGYGETRFASRAV